MPPYVLDPAGVDDPLARSVARLVATLGRTPWPAEGPPSVKVSTLAKRLGPIEPEAVASLVASGFAAQVRDGADPWIRPTGLALAVGGFAGSALDLLEHDEVPPLVVDLARAGLSSVPAEGLAFHLGREVDELWTDLGTLADAGLVALWPDHPAGPAASLTALAASRLALRLASDGSRWLRAGDADPTLGRPSGPPEDDDDLVDPIALAVDRREVGGLDGLLLAELVNEARDHRFSAINEAMDPVAARERSRAQRSESRADTVERRRLIEACRRLPAAERHARVRELEARQRADRWNRVAERTIGGDPVDLSPPPLPPFRHFLGMRAPWPIPVGPRESWRPWRPSDGPCPECGGNHLGPLAVCLHCHASGMDGLFGVPRPPAESRPTNRPAMATKPTRSGAAKDAPGLKGGIG